MNPTLVGTVSRRDVEFAEDDFRKRKRTLKLARSKYRVIYWKERFVALTNGLRRLASRLGNKVAAALTIATVCLALAVPFLILCSFGVLGVLSGMGVAYAITASASLLLLCFPDDRSFQERVTRLSLERTSRFNAVQVALHFLKRAEDRYFEVRQIYESQRNRLLRTDWRLLRGSDFESFLAAVFWELGYQVQRTGAAGDQGVDLILTIGQKRIAAQAKGCLEGVGNNAIQQVYAGQAIHGCQRCVVVTNSWFTPGAQEAAQCTGCMLLDGDQMEDLILGKIL